MLVSVADCLPLLAAFEKLTRIVLALFIIIFASDEQVVEDRQPRTIIGEFSNHGKILCIVRFAVPHDIDLC